MTTEIFTNRDYSCIDYFIFGDIVSDRSKWVMNHLKCLNLQRASFVQLKDTLNAESVKTIFDEIQDKTIIKIDKKSNYPSKQLTEFFHVVEQLTQEKRIHILVDLNSLDREYLLLLSSLLFSIEQNISIRFIYFSAKFYDIPKWKSLKHDKPVILSTHPGIPCFSSSVLLVLSGFEIDALGRLVQYYQPDKLLLGYNRNGVTKEIEKANKEMIMRKAVDYKNIANISVVDFPCDVKNPDVCFQEIQAVLEDKGIIQDGVFSEYVRIASTNTKLALVGTMLFASKFSDVQVVYTKPIDFKEDEYSKGVKDYYEYEYER